MPLGQRSQDIEPELNLPKEHLSHSVNPVKEYEPNSHLVQAEEPKVELKNPKVQLLQKEEELFENLPGRHGSQTIPEEEKYPIPQLVQFDEFVPDIRPAGQLIQLGYPCKANFPAEHVEQVSIPSNPFVEVPLLQILHTSDFGEEYFPAAQIWQSMVPD